MQISEVIDMVSDELRDSRQTKYSRTSILYKLKEAMTQFASDSNILKNSVQILPVAGTAVYNLPVYGQAFKDYTGQSYIATVADSLVTPTYLRLIRLGFRDFSNSGANDVMHPNSTFERDEVGNAFNQAGPPLYHYNDELSFYEFGVWPVPDTSALDQTGVDKRLQVDYVRDVLYYSDSAYTTPVSRSAATENDYLDSAIPAEFLSKIYLLVCFLRLKNSIDPTDVQKAANYLQLYETELLNKALESGSHMDRYNQFKVRD